jgi:hypothetical protein
MAEQHLAPYDPPELKRMPLGDVCLLVKSLGFADIAGFLARVPDPPAAAAVASAVGELQALWALDEAQNLTPLGRLLALLPGKLPSCWAVVLLRQAASCAQDPRSEVVACAVGWCCSSAEGDSHAHSTPLPLVCTCAGVGNVVLAKGVGGFGLVALHGTS